MFPKEDVIKLAYASPTAVFHEAAEYDKSKGGFLMDLSRKILIFIDQPHNDLLARLRPLLSHDSKEITLKITDKNQKHGLRTKTIILRGYPAVIFCTAGLRIDEQETTRMLLLSPDVDEEKIRAAIDKNINCEADREAFQKSLDSDPQRQLLKKRIRALRQQKIDEIRIGRPEIVKASFLGDKKKLKPRHMRDVGHVMSLAKAFALLNVWFRERNGSTIVANEEDIEEAFKLWKSISESQDSGIPPYIVSIYDEVIVPKYEEKGGGNGLTRQEVMQEHYQKHGRPISGTSLRQQILPMLENAGWIKQEADPEDRRKKLIYPTRELTISEEEEPFEEFDPDDF